MRHIAKKVDDVTTLLRALIKRNCELSKSNKVLVSIAIFQHSTQLPFGARIHFCKFRKL